MKRFVLFPAPLSIAGALLIVALLGFTSTTATNPVRAGYPQTLPADAPIYSVYLPGIVRGLPGEVPDLGDASDSSNSHGVGMTAYPAGGPAGCQRVSPPCSVLARHPMGRCTATRN